MVGYYKIETKILEQLDFPIKNIENNIYDLCCPLFVMDKKDVPENILYLYETLEIPILNVTELRTYDKKEYRELEAYLKVFSHYLQLNIPIEMSEEQKLGHLLRVGKYAKKLAEALLLSKEEVKSIYIASLFHDIGKSRIPESIIGKKGKLTEEEFSIIKTHSSLAREVLGNFLDETILEMIEAHHERMDGSGYTKGLLPSLGVQIIGIADSYDAMVSSRVYHNAASKEDALNELLLCTKEKEVGGKGILYNPKLVRKFIEIEKASEY